MFDNSDLHQKIRIRNNVFKYVENIDNKTCLEYFAGNGNLTNFWVKICKNVISIEKEKDKLNSIKNYTNLQKINENNIRYIDLSKDIEIIDCDAYGLVTDFIKQILDVNQIKKKIIFFTDGYYKVQKKKNFLISSFDEKLKECNPAYYYYEKATSGNVYYGYLYFEHK